jgi:hypothetical protein
MITEKSILKDIISSFESQLISEIITNKLEIEKLEIKIKKATTEYVIKERLLRERDSIVTKHNTILSVYLKHLQKTNSKTDYQVIKQWSWTDVP